MSNPIPEFDSPRNLQQELAEAQAELARLRELVEHYPPLVKPLPPPPTAPSQSSHHPNCAQCCAMNRCHWCLNRPESGTLTSTGPDGYVYSACRAHVNYFAEMQRRASPSAGVDLRAGLANVEISVPSPLTR